MPAIQHCLRVSSWICLCLFIQEKRSMASKESGKKTLCGYAWNDVYSALTRSIANGNMRPAQRWGAELLCSQTGVSRMEAVLFAIWAEHIGSALGKWPALWQSNITVFRDEWVKSGGDNAIFRNNANIRNRIAECIGYLVVASKHPRPSLPKSTDVFKEAEAVRARLQGGGASADQVSTQRIWDSREDAPTMRTLGNELEASIRTAQTSRALFWLVWIMTLDGQKLRPNIKERAPSHIQGKARKNLAWFILALLSDLAANGLDAVGCIKQTIDCLQVVWIRLGSKSRREVLGTIIVMLCERVKSSSFEVRNPHECLDTRPIRTAIEDIDSIYEEIAKDKSTQTVQIGQTDADTNTINAPGNDLKKFKKQQKNNSDINASLSADKMNKAYNLLRKMYGMDEED